MTTWVRGFHRTVPAVTAPVALTDDDLGALSPSHPA